MNQTKKEVQGGGAGKPAARKDWELFWRILAGLMLIVIGWVAWVMYQITPRPVVTPLAFESKSKPIGTLQPPVSAVTPGVSPSQISPAPEAQAASAVAPSAAGAAEAVLTMNQAQAALREGAHQASADVQAAALEKGQQALRSEVQPTREGLKLSTEINAPVVDEKKIPAKREGKPGGD